MSYHRRISVKAASSGNLTLAGAQTIDGISCAAGNIVLAKDQTDARENGLYTVVHPGAWTRYAGMLAYDVALVASGGSPTANFDGFEFILITSGFTLGTTSLYWKRLIDLTEPNSGKGLAETVTVGTAADADEVIVAWPTKEVSVQHIGYRSDGLTACTNPDGSTTIGDGVFLSNASGSITASLVADQSKEWLQPGDSVTRNGAEWAPSYGYDHCMLMTMSENTAKVRLCVGQIVSR